MEEYYDETLEQELPKDMLDKNGWLREDILFSLWCELISDYHSCYSAPLYKFRNQFGLDITEVKWFFEGYAIYLWENYLACKYPDDDYPRGDNEDDEDFKQNFEEYDSFANLSSYYASWGECPFTNVNINSYSLPHDFTSTPLWGDISPQDTCYVYLNWRRKDVRGIDLSYYEKPLFHLW